MDFCLKSEDAMNENDKSIEVDDSRINTMGQKNTRKTRNGQILFEFKTLNKMTSLKIMYGVI
jgi:hypothetical protein